MVRKYPFDLIDGDVVDIKTATSIAIKFLNKNNCLDKYIEAWLNRHKVSCPSNLRSEIAKYVVGCTTKILCENGLNLNDFFSSIRASFDWEESEKLGQDIREWKKISDKWRMEIGYGVRIIS